MLLLILLACDKPASPADTGASSAETGLEGGDTAGDTDLSPGGVPDSGDTAGPEETASPADTDTADTAAPGGEDTDEAPLPDTIEVEGVGFDGPESMIHDPVGDYYLVSNIVGSPGEADDNGFISRLNPDGSVAELAWIDGADDGVTLNAPKALAIHGDELLVADLDTVRRFDLETGAPLGGYAVEGASFNGLTVGPDGALYASRYANDDSAAIWRIPTDGGEPAILLGGASVAGSNGLAGADEGVYVVTGGGEVYLLATDGARSDLPTAPEGGLDGVVVLEDGALLVSSWRGEAVYRLADGEYETAVEGVSSPADIGLDAARGRVLIPQLSSDRVVIQQL